MAFIPSQYTLATVALLGIDPDEFLLRASKSKYSTLLFLLGEYDIGGITTAGDNIGLFPRQTFRSGLQLAGGKEPKLVLSFDGSDSLNEGDPMPNNVGTMTLVPTSAMKDN